MSDLNTVEGGLEYIANSPPAWAAGGFHRYIVQIAKQAQAEIVTLRATTREQADQLAAKDATIAGLREALEGLNTTSYAINLRMARTASEQAHEIARLRGEVAELKGRKL